ncbi:MAG TPA: hypothetical protein VFP46_02390, partial [Candidatus Paceibacterota bacterium]|nr:hypothetical protein [Candidatus Paceibacterota bacterium]
TPEQMAGPACGTSPGPSCTNVAGMQPATVQQVINVANACGGRPGFNVCGLVVTGGTEPGHACGPTSHSAGYKVDLGINSALDTYLKGWLGQPTSVRGGDSGGPVRNDSCGNEYVQESNHWDIKVKTACGTVTPPPNNPTPRTWPPSTQTFQYFGNAIRVNNVASGQENFFAFNFAAGQGTTLAAVAYQIPGTPDGTDTITVYGPNDSIVAGPESCSTFYCIARVNNAAPGLYHVIVVQTFSATPPNPSVGAFGANMSL